MNPWVNGYNVAFICDGSRHECTRRLYRLNKPVVHKTGDGQLSSIVTVYDWGKNSGYK